MSRVLVIDEEPWGSLDEDGFWTVSHTIKGEEPYLGLHWLLVEHLIGVGTRKVYVYERWAGRLWIAHPQFVYEKGVVRKGLSGASEFFLDLESWDFTHGDAESKMDMDADRLVLPWECRECVTCKSIQEGTPSKQVVSEATRVPAPDGAVYG